MNGLRASHFTKGQVVVREGESGASMFIVREGRLRAGAGAGTQSRNMAFYREGDFFGELAILTGAPRTATVEAATDCTLLELSSELVKTLSRRFPEFGRLMEERRAQYAHETEARVPLDFAQELLPAEASVASKTADAETPDDGRAF